MPGIKEIISYCIVSVFYGLIGKRRKSKQLNRLGKYIQTAKLKKHPIPISGLLQIAINIAITAIFLYCEILKGNMLFSIAVAISGLLSTLFVGIENYQNRNIAIFYENEIIYDTNEYSITKLRKEENNEGVVSIYKKNKLIFQYSVNDIVKQTSIKKKREKLFHS